MGDEFSKRKQFAIKGSSVARLMMDCWGTWYIRKKTNEIRWSFINEGENLFTCSGKNTR